jgi:RNA polymerase sigma factor (sigma-70 family)
MRVEMEPISVSDDQLVEGTRCGDRDAFAQIVRKYQSLICALTYSACGHLQTSEDLAQMTFVTAWSEMPKLQQPSKLKSWLCGIARNLAKNSLREQQYIPSAKAQGLDQIRDVLSEEPSPCEVAISKEEEAILWRTLSELPPTYRDPLVLFYRQHQSAGEVADALGLTEDAVHQRLSRGRMMLTERITRFVETTLSNTGPSKAFSLAVLSAIPVLTKTGKVASIGVATAKASATAAKATGLGALLQALMVFTPIAILGGYLGCKMGRDAGESISHKSVVTFWRIVALSLIAFVALPLLLTGLWIGFRVPIPKETVFAGLKIWLGILYSVILSALCFWLWQRRQKVLLPEITANRRKTTNKNRLAIWIVLSVIGAACLLVALFFDTNWNVQHLSTNEVRYFISDMSQKPVQFSILKTQQGNRRFWIQLRENGKVTKFSAPFDFSTLALINERGFTCPVYVQGRDYEVLGWPGYLLVFFCVFILAIGIAILLKQPRRKLSGRE